VRTEEILLRFGGVKRTGRDTWCALCPSHEDKRPSLDIRRAADGRTLLVCRAGCSAAEIVASVGITLADLFPDGGRFAKPAIRSFPATHVLRTLGLESLVILAAGKAMLAGNFAPGELERLTLAVSRVQDGLAAAGMLR
jgi:hypothetical protein